MCFSVNFDFFMVSPRLRTVRSRYLALVSTAHVFRGDVRRRSRELIRGGEEGPFDAETIINRLPHGAVSTSRAMRRT